MKNIQIAILDFGSQYTQLIARRIRDLGVYCEIFNYSISSKKLKSLEIKGVILSGGPKSVNSDSFKIDNEIWNLNIPILGICYGMQLIGKKFNVKIKKSNTKQFGSTLINISNESKLFNGINKKIN